MSTNPDETQDTPSASEATAGETPAPSTTEEPRKSTPAKKILIGSQRDAADPAHGSKAIRYASLTPEKAESAIQTGHAPDTGAPGETEASGETGPANPAATVPPAASETVREPVAETTTAVETATRESAAAEPGPEAVAVAEPPASGTAIDAELEAALDDLQMDSLMGVDQPVVEIEIDSRIKALVTRIHNDHVFVSLKGRFEGIASKRQFKVPPQEGAMLEVVVTGFREDEGLYEVSIPGASVSVADWSDLVEGAVVQAKVTGSNTGGLECTVNSIRGFIPASQIDVVRVENFGDFVNQKIQCVVVEVNPGRKKLVLSRRAILERERQEQKAELMKTLAAGQTMEGVVTRLMDFGAFVDIGGVEGLVHVSKMSWERVDHPQDVLEAGQRIPVRVEKINAETGKISLSYRDTQENPWNNIEQKYPQGSVIGGTVSRLAQFGAFVKLEPGVEGLVHISELAHHRVMAVRNIVSQGDSVQVKVLSVDSAAQKIGLSLKATQAKPEKADERRKEADENEPIRESAVKKRSEPLKGGRDRGSGGDQFGLNW